MRSPLTLTELRECLTAAQVADIQQESDETIRRRCRQGQYGNDAVNIGTAKRPRWRIHPRALGRVLPEVADTAA